MKKILKISIFIFYFLFIGFSLIFHLESGELIAQNFLSFAFSMLKIVPVAFVLIGLFEVWVKRETIEKHLGDNSSWLGFLWAILLSGTTVGGLYVAFPIAAVLHKKGAKLSVIFTYLGASAICRIPMMIFESSFLGIKFTLVRLLVSLPLIIISSVIMGNILTKTNYAIARH
ncbi:MAG: permease [Candidatus Tenebribacter mawsonii]|nr:permease [Candidatus Tenebribacter mawsonii]